MQRLTQLLKQVFTVSVRQELPASAFEMTLHDALRIGASRLPRND